MSKIIDKVKKLLRLSEDPTNEHVAEAAAAKAQELIQEHNIQEELLRDPETSSSREPPKWQGWVFEGRACQTWKVNLATALARSNYGTIGIWSGQGVQFCGSEQDYKLVSSLYEWIAIQIHDSARKKCDGQREYNSYKLGAVSTISARLKKAKLDAEAQAKVEALCNELDGKNELVLVENAITTLNDYGNSAQQKANKTLSGSWRGGRGATDRSAFQQGVQDGKSISLQLNQLKG